AVCTRDRPDDLRRCLDGLERLAYPLLDLLVIDNAPVTEASKREVLSRNGRIRYALEHRPGLSWARNRAIAEAKGEILAFTDDDVFVDPGWVTALVEAFVSDPGTMAVTGLVVPSELETDAQVRHSHRRSMTELRAQMSDHGVGFSAYVVRSAAAYPDERVAFGRLAAWWLAKIVYRALRPRGTPAGPMRRLALAELVGLFR